MNKEKLNNLIDMHLVESYLRTEGTSCLINIMTRTEKEKVKIIEEHIKNVYPIKEILKEGDVVGYYTKMNPENRNHSGKISAKTLDDLKTKIIAKYLEIEIHDYTCADIIKLVEEEYDANNQDATGDTHRQNFYRCFPQFEKVKIRNLSSQMIEDALKKLIDNGIKSKAFDKAISTLNRMQSYCKYNKIPCLDIHMVVADYRKEKLTGKHIFIQDNRETKNLSFTEPEATEIVNDAIQHPTYKGLFAALDITTGCRAGELLCMATDNISEDHKWFIVKETEDSKTREIKKYTKSHELREVYLNANARKLLELLLELRSQDPNPSRFLFLNEYSDDGKLHLRAADDYLRDLQVKLKFDKSKEIRSLHDGRRTYASIQYLKGVKIDTIRRQLGHKTISQTEEYIKEIIDKRQKEEDLEKGCMDLEATA